MIKNARYNKRNTKQMHLKKEINHNTEVWVISVSKLYALKFLLLAYAYEK